MARQKEHKVRKICISFLLFFLAFVLVFFGIQFFTKTGFFKTPGIVYYDETLKDEEILFLESIFTKDIILDKDVRILAYEKNEISSKLNNNEFIYEVFVPVANFYESRRDIIEFVDDEYEFIPIDALDNKKKLLSINGEYYLDNFDSGAIFRVINFESEKYEEEIEPLVRGKFSKTFPEKTSVLSFAQTGVTALSRGINARLYEINDANYFAEYIKDYLSSFDLTHTSNESSFSDYASANNICSDPRFINTLVAIGLDIVELTGNHNQDCGDEAANSTIDIYKNHGVRIVGGGKTAAEAAIPLQIDEKGNNITFLAYNLSTGGATYDGTPGANQYYEENVISEITSAKARGDFIIVDIQYYECSTYVSTEEDTTCDYADSSAGDQIGFFRHLVDLGADIVVGTSAHQPQTFETYGNGVIYYGLGNLFFDQSWWPGTTRSLILAHYFYQNKLLQTRIVPTIYDDTLQTKLMDNVSVEQFLKRLADIHP